MIYACVNGEALAMSQIEWLHQLKLLIFMVIDKKIITGLISAKSYPNINLSWRSYIIFTHIITDLSADTYTSVPIQGSGTFSVEATIQTSVPRSPNTKVRLLSHSLVVIHCIRH